MESRHRELLPALDSLKLLELEGSLFPLVPNAYACYSTGKIDVNLVGDGVREWIIVDLTEVPKRYSLGPVNMCPSMTKDLLR